MPVLAGEELAVSFDGIAVGSPALPQDVVGGIALYHANFSVWAAREGVIPDDTFGSADLQQMEPAEIQAVAARVLPDARVLLDAGLAALDSLGVCEKGVVRAVIPLVAQGGLVGNVMRLEIGLL